MSAQQLQAAQKAVGHTLRAICEDPRKYFLLGPGSESFELLVEAYAALFEVDLKKAREIAIPERAAYEAYLAERHERARLIEIGRQHDTGGAS